MKHVESSNPETGKTGEKKWEKSILDSFSKLNATNEKARLKSGVNLLRYLTSNSNNENGEKELNYALGRLIRGLGASAFHMRAGYFSTLVQLLNMMQSDQPIDLERIFKLIDKELQKSGSNSKGENADICMGQIFTLGAVIRSELFNKASVEDRIKVVKMLVEAGKERTYSYLAAYSFITELCQRASPDDFKVIVWPSVKPEIVKAWSEQTPDSIFLLIYIQDKFPKLLTSKILQPSLGAPEIITETTLPHLATVLMGISRISHLKHPVFTILPRKLAEKPALIPGFCHEIDLRNSTKPNRCKFMAATKILTETLNSVPDSNLVPELICGNHLQQIIGNFQTCVGHLKDLDFKKAVLAYLDCILNQLKRDGTREETKIAVIKRFLFYPGTFIFEKLTGTKIVQNITALLGKEGVKSLGEIYKGVIMAQEDRLIGMDRTEKWRNNDRLYASHLLVKLISHPAITKSSWKIKQLKFLMVLGLIRDDGGNVSNELADQLKETFYAALDLKSVKIDELRDILSSIVTKLDSQINLDTLNDKLRHPISQEDYETWQRVVSTTSKTKQKKTIKRVFDILFLHLGLQLFNKTKLAVDSLNELFICYEKTKNNNKTESNNLEDPLWIEVVIDLFLNLLSHNSHLLRTIINSVFPHLCEFLNDNAILQILSVLDPKAEENPLSKYSGDSSDDDDNPDNENDNDKSDDDGSSNDESGSEEEEEEEEGAASSDRLRLALHQALGNGFDPGSDLESIDLDTLDEVEGERLNTALADAFKQYRPNLRMRKKQDREDETLAHFRLRVLDLIDSFLDSTAPSIHLVLNIMFALLQILEFSIRNDRQGALQGRVKSSLKKLTGLKKFGNTDGIDDSQLGEFLESLLEKGTKNTLIVQEMGEKISDCCCFIIGYSDTVNAKNSKNSKIEKTKVFDVIKNSLQAYYERRDCLVPYAVFKAIMQLNWPGILGLSEILMPYVFAEDRSRPFRRSQALELLKLFYSNHRFINNTDNRQKFGEKQTEFLNDCVEFLQRFGDDPRSFNVKEKFLCYLFLLLTAMKSSNCIDESYDWTRIAQVTRDCRSGLSFSKDTKSAFNKLCGALKVSNIVQMKSETVKLGNSVEDGDAVRENGDGTSKRKKNRGKDAKKLKKEAKELRLMSLSKGLESVEAEGDKKKKRKSEDAGGKAKRKKKEV